MSLILYLASDEPLDVVPNPHCKSLSVNEALEMGITDIPDELLALSFDRDQPNVILWSDRNIIIDTENGTFDDGGFDDDFEIYDMNEHYGPSETTKPYRVIVDCNWTPGRAKNILSYIQEQLDYTDEIEVWSVWLGDYDQKTVYYDAQIDSFTPEDLIEIAGLPIQQNPLKHHCVRIRK